MQSTTNRRGKRRSALQSLERDAQQPQLVPMNLGSKLDQAVDSFTPIIGEPASVVASATASRVQTQHGADGTIRMTIKKQDSRVSDKPAASDSQQHQATTNQKKSTSKSKRRKVEKAASAANVVASSGKAPKATDLLQSSPNKEQTANEIDNVAEGVAARQTSELENAQFKSQE